MSSCSWQRLWHLEQWGGLVGEGAAPWAGQATQIWPQPARLGHLSGHRRPPGNSLHLRQTWSEVPPSRAQPCSPFL